MKAIFINEAFEKKSKEDKIRNLVLPDIVIFTSLDNSEYLYFKHTDKEYWVIKEIMETNNLLSTQIEFDETMGLYYEITPTSRRKLITPQPNL